MAIMDIKLVKNAAKAGDKEWEGQCPACKTHRIFAYKHYEVDRLKAVTNRLIDIATTGGLAPFIALFSDPVEVLIGCSNCKHTMAICPNCKIAFSIDANANFITCPSCNKRYTREFND